MMGNKCCGVHGVAWALVLVGALNWGLVGLAKFNLVEWIFGAWPTVIRVVYVLVGLAALAMLAKGMCKGCTNCATMDKK